MEHEPTVQYYFNFLSFIRVKAFALDICVNFIKKLSCCNCLYIITYIENWNLIVGIVKVKGRKKHF